MWALAPEAATHYSVGLQRLKPLDFAVHMARLKPRPTRLDFVVQNPGRHERDQFAYGRVDACPQSPAPDADAAAAVCAISRAVALRSCKNLKNSTPSRSRRFITSGSRSIPPNSENIFRGRK